MDRARYDEYLSYFNSKQYDRVIEFWAPKFSCMLGDSKLFGSPETLKQFYSFLHDHVKEEIFVDHFLSSEDKLFMEARVRITGLKEMTRELIDKSGFTSLTPIEKGAVIELPQFIHYHLRDGKFVSAVCLISATPTFSRAD